MPKKQYISFAIITRNEYPRWNLLTILIKAYDYLEIRLSYDVPIIKNDNIVTAGIEANFSSVIRYRFYYHGVMLKTLSQKEILKNQFHNKTQNCKKRSIPLRGTIN